MLDRPPITDLSLLISEMAPELHRGVYVFVSVPDSGLGDRGFGNSGIGDSRGIFDVCGDASIDMRDREVRDVENSDVEGPADQGAAVDQDIVPLGTDAIPEAETAREPQPESRAIPAGVIATFREKEGLSMVVEESVAIAAGLDILFRSAWITLRVNSALEAVGLTSAVSLAFTEAGIPCNVIAAARHDHLFVPVEMSDRAMGILHQLQRSAA